MNEVLNFYFEEPEKPQAKQDIDGNPVIVKQLSILNEKIKLDPDFMLGQLHLKTEKIINKHKSYEDRFSDFEAFLAQQQEGELDMVDSLKKSVTDTYDGAKESAMKEYRLKKEKYVNKGYSDLVDFVKKSKIGGIFPVGWIWFLDIETGVKDLVGIDDDKEILDSEENDEDTDDSDWFSGLNTKLTSWIIGFAGGKALNDQAQSFKSGYEFITDTGMKAIKGAGEKIKPLVSERGEVTQDPDTVTETSEVNYDKKIQIHYKMGTFLLKEMGNENFDNQNYTIDLSRINTLSYEEFGKKKNSINDNTKNIRDALHGDQMDIVFKNLFTDKNITNLFEAEKSIPLLDTLDVNMGEVRNWQHLTIHQLLSISSMILSSYFTGITEEAQGAGSELKNFFFNIDDAKFYSNFKEDILDKKSKISNDQILKNIFLKSELSEPGSFNGDLSDEIIAQYLDVDENDEDFRELLEFKKFVNTRILTNFDYTHGKEVKKFVSFKNVFELYVLFQGEVPSADSDIDNFQELFITSWIGMDVLKNKKELQGEYIASFFINNSNSSEGSNSNELVLLFAEKYKHIKTKEYTGLLEKLVGGGMQVVKTNPLESAGIVAALVAILGLTPILPMVGMFKNIVWASSAVTGLAVWNIMSVPDQEKLLTDNHASDVDELIEKIIEEGDNKKI